MNLELILTLKQTQISVLDEYKEHKFKRIFQIADSIKHYKNTCPANFHITRNYWVIT